MSTELTINQSIVILCVNYNNEPDTLEFVRSCLGLEYPGSLRIVVVDNSEKTSVKLALAQLAKTNDRVRVLTTGANLGYFGAVAWALKQDDSALNADWIIVSNTDISFLQEAFFTLLAKWYPGGVHGILAPALHSTLTGGRQNPYLISRPTRERMYFYKWLSKSYVAQVAYDILGLARQRLLAIWRRHRPDGPSGVDGEAPRSIYAPHGSFIVFHRSYFEAGGNLDYGSFLFGEEIFIGETVRRLGLSVTYDPRLKVIHQEHATTGVFKNRKTASYVRQSAAYLADVFFGSAVDEREVDQ